jgi:hypothetical protein
MAEEQLQQAEQASEYDPVTADRAEPLYVRYYSGHAGKFGHEFLGMQEIRIYGDVERR